MIVMDFFDQVCSPDQALRLKELGLNQPSTWFFRYKNQKREFPILDTTFMGRTFLAKKHVWAFTSAELGKLIPARHLHLVWKLRDRWIISNTHSTKITDHPTEAQARAQLLISLLERKDLSLDEIRREISRKATT